MVQNLHPASLEERVTRLHELMTEAGKEVVREFRERLDMSWIYHDCALEGVMHSFEELKAAIDDQVVSDSSLLPTYDEIRQHKAAIDLVREVADKKRSRINLELVRKIYMAVTADEEDIKVVEYRKDMPLHRLYFHEIAQPDKIAGQMDAVIAWINAPDTKRSTHTVRLAAKAHYRLMRAYPFKKNSGKVARLVMNLILLRQGYPPVILHATERQRYYDALKTSEDGVAKLITEALAASVESAVRHFEAALGLSFSA